MIEASSPARPATQPTTTRRPAALRVEHLWLSLPVALLVWAVLAQPFGLVDFWWHLKTGEILFTEGRLLRANEFSFTAPGVPDTPHGWLAQLVFYILYRTGGLELLVVLNVLLRVAALLPVYGLVYEATDRRPRLSMLVALLPAEALAIHGTLRPQVFSFAHFSLFLWILAEFQRGRRNLLWLLPVLTALWVNLHGAFVLGLGLIVLQLLGESARRWALGPRDDVLSGRALMQLGMALVACGVATLFNPDGPAIYGFVQAVQSSQAVQQLVSEWQPPRINEWSGVRVFYLPFFLLVTALIYDRRRLPFTQWLGLVCWALFALTALRNAMWFLLVATPVLAGALANLAVTEFPALARRFPTLSRLAGQWGGRATNSAAHTLALNGLVLVVLVGITVVLSPWVYPRLRSHGHLWEPRTPVGAMDYLQQYRVGGRIFHHQLFGDYLIWRLYPAQRSFIDGRTHLFPREFVEDYLAVFNDPHWEKRLARHDIRLLLLCKHGEEAKLIQSARTSGRWRPLYEDDVSVLFERVEPSANGAKH
jgi:hypothetical protein